MPENTMNQLENNVITSGQEQEKNSRLMDKINELTNIVNQLQDQNAKRVLEKPKFHTVKVRYVDEAMTQMVVGYGKHREVTIPTDGSRVGELEVFYQDKDKVKSKWLPAVQFFNESKFVVAKIIDEYNVGNKVSMGYVRRQTVKGNDFSPTDDGYEVPVEVNTPVFVYKLELPSGEIVELNQNAIN